MTEGTGATPKPAGGATGQKPDQSGAGAAGGGAAGKTPPAAPKVVPNRAGNTGPKLAVKPAANPGAKPGPKPGASGANAKPKQKPVKPVATRTRMKMRHWGLVSSFVALVVVPFAVVCFYLWAIAADQYGSVTGFTVRKEEGGNASELLGGLSQLTGANSASDGDILYEFVLSQALVQAVEEETGLVAHYSQLWKKDPVFALWPNPTIEDLEWYWQRIVKVAYDSGSGLIEVKVLAFEPEKAQEIARVIVDKSQQMINALNVQAREDSMRYARDDLAESVERLKDAREALTAFRIRTQIVDPAADIQGRMGVMNNLQQQLAEALIEYDLLSGTINPDDPRIVQETRRIQVIRDRIASERQSFASEGPTGGTGAGPGGDYPNLMAEYEGLVVDRQFSEETYRAALTALGLARANAQRQSRYLATYVRPTLAESSEYPRRSTIAALFGLFVLLAWSVLALVYYSIRDRA